MLRGVAMKRPLGGACTRGLTYAFTFFVHVSTLFLSRSFLPWIIAPGGVFVIFIRYYTPVVQHGRLPSTAVNDGFTFLSSKCAKLRGLNFSGILKCQWLTATA